MPDDIDWRAFPVFGGYLRERGRWYLAAEKPKGVRKGTDKRCFVNASKLRYRRPDLAYCEGVALHKFGWMHHAWCATSTGVVVDPTWVPPALAYFGVEVDPRTEAETALATGHYGVLEEMARLEQRLEQPSVNRPRPTRTGLDL